MSHGPSSVMILVILQVLHPFKPCEVLKDVAYPHGQSTCKLASVTHTCLYTNHTVFWKLCSSFYQVWHLLLCSLLFQPYLMMTYQLYFETVPREGVIYQLHKEVFDDETCNNLFQMIFDEWNISRTPIVTKRMLLKILSTRKDMLISLNTIIF